jgi:hypothetical protein
VRDRDAGRTFRYAALAAGVYLDGNVVGLSVPGLLGIASQGPRTAGQVAILLSVALLPVTLVARARRTREQHVFPLVLWSSG